MNKPFNLEAFRNGQKALTRDGRVATFIGICEGCEEFSRLLVLLEGDDQVMFFSLNGKFEQSIGTYNETRYDLVSMVSRHQHLIDSYDPEDMWQFSINTYDKWFDVEGKPEWEENREFRLHPHNDPIKAWKRGAKIQVFDNIFTCKGYIDDSNPEWHEKLKYRIKSEPEFTYPIYKQSTTDKLVVKFTSLDTGEIIRVGSHPYEVGSTHSNFILHTNTNVWKDWTPLQDKPTTKTIYEWMVKGEFGYWHLNGLLLTEDKAAKEFAEYEYKKTGRDWKVEV